MTDTKRACAYDALEKAINMLAECSFDDGEVAVDAVLLVGVQRIDDEGDRWGYVYLFPRHGCQPAYITSGLLEQGRHHVRGKSQGLDN